MQDNSNNMGGLSQLWCVLFDLVAELANSYLRLSTDFSLPCNQTKGFSMFGRKLITTKPQRLTKLFIYYLPDSGWPGCNVFICGVFVVLCYHIWLSERSFNNNTRRLNGFNGKKHHLLMWSVTNSLVSVVSKITRSKYF